MHAALRWIFSNDSIDDYFFLAVTTLDKKNSSQNRNIPFTEPALFASELACGLGRRCWHKDESNKTNDESEKCLFLINSEILRGNDTFYVAYLNEEQPSPSGLSTDTSEVEETKSKEGSEYVGNGHGSPKECEANG